MTEHHDEPTTVHEGPARPRFRDRVWSLRAVIAVALAAVLLGGLAGAAIATVGGRDHRGDRPGFGRMGGPGKGMPPGQRRKFGQQGGPGQGRGDWHMRWGNRGPGSPSPSATAQPSPSQTS